MVTSSTPAWLLRYRRALYPLLGALLALGAPGGLLLLRALAARRLPGPSFLAGELAALPLVYAYLLVSTTIVFVLLGYVLGRREDQLRAVSITDPLTGLANRRQLHRRLAQELAMAARYKHPLSLLVVDVDRLKQINDQHGHQAGDAALRRVAECLRDTCRITDVAARYGGDEFVVLAPVTTGPQALDLAERIRTNLAASASGAPGAPAVTLSIGIADLERVQAPTAEELYRAADRALYRAKAQGRDRAELCDLVAPRAFVPLSPAPLTPEGAVPPRHEGQPLRA